jgi:thiamine pyrophosphokinase
MHALVLADGDAATRAALDQAWPGWDAGASLVVAADGGAALAGPLEVGIDRWVGDGDSIGASGLESLRAAGVAVEVAPTDKDESDTELAVRAALDAGAKRITIVGALGGPRLDHALANVALLGMAELAGRDVRLVASEARVRLLAAIAPPDRTPAYDGVAVDLEGRPGDLVSLFPVGADVEGVSTDGLRYPLVDATLLVGRTRGLSNVRTAAVARVAIRLGRLLVIETPGTIDG